MARQFKRSRRARSKPPPKIDWSLPALSGWLNSREPYIRNYKPTGRTLDDELLTKLTTLAKVSAEHAGKFRQRVCFNVDQEWYWHAQPKIITEPRPLKHAIIQLRRLARSLQSVQTNLQNLNPHALDMLRIVSTWIASRTRPDEPPPLLPFDDFAQHKKTVAMTADPQAIAKALGGSSASAARA